MREKPHVNDARILGELVRNHPNADQFNHLISYLISQVNVLLDPESRVNLPSMILHSIPFDSSADCLLSFISKKELLLQKLREKDAVIESLLKQLQNPHPQINLKDAPRLSPSISSSLPQGTPGEKEIDKDILEWIQRAQDSVRSTNYNGTQGYRIVDGLSLEDDDSLESGSSEGANRTLDSHLSPSKSSVSDSGRSSGYKGGLLAPDQHAPKSSPKLHSLPLEEAPVGLLADLALTDLKEKEKERRRSRSRSKSRSASGAGGSDQSKGKSKEGDNDGGDDDDDDDGQLGVASRNYFQPGPAAKLGLRTIQIERRNIPEIMTSGLISPAEVDKLFKIFFEKLNVSL